MTYKDFIIFRRNKNRWDVLNLNGELLRSCKTKKECIKRIDEQTI